MARRMRRKTLISNRARWGALRAVLAILLVPGLLATQLTRVCPASYRGHFSCEFSMSMSSNVQAWSKLVGTATSATGQATWWWWWCSNGSQVLYHLVMWHSWITHCSAHSNHYTRRFWDSGEGCRSVRDKIERHMWPIRRWECRDSPGSWNCKSSAAVDSTMRPRGRRLNRGRGQGQGRGHRSKERISVHPVCQLSAFD